MNETDTPLKSDVIDTPLWELREVLNLKKSKKK